MPLRKISNPEGSYVVTEKSCAGYVVDDAQRIIHLKANDTVPSGPVFQSS